MKDVSSGLIAILNVFEAEVVREHHQAKMKSEKCPEGSCRRWLGGGDLASQHRGTVLGTSVLESGPILDQIQRHEHHGYPLLGAPAAKKSPCGVGGRLELFKEDKTRNGWARGSGTHLSRPDPSTLESKAVG